MLKANLMTLENRKRFYSLKKYGTNFTIQIVKPFFGEFMFCGSFPLLFIKPYYAATHMQINSLLSIELDDSLEN